MSDEQGAIPAADRLTDTGGRDQIARAILDGWYEGNEEWDSPHNDTLQMRAYWAADAVLALATPKPPVDAGEDPRSAFYGESTAAQDVLPTTQVVAIDSFLRAVARIRNLSDDGETM